MIDMSGPIVQTFTNDSTLVGLLGGPRVDRLKASNADEYPRITFFELTNFGADYADDVEASSQVEFQVDVWSQGAFTAIAERVDDLMQQIGFSRVGTMEMFEEDTLVYHKAMRYRMLATQEG